MIKTKTLTVTLAAVALTAAIGLPAWSAIHDANEGSSPVSSVSPLASLFGSDQSARPMVVAEGEDNADEGPATTTRSSGDNDEDSCEEDEGNCGSAATAPPAAGTVPPPQNGLFGTAPAQVQIK